ncbi:MAG: 4-methyl-5(b-hydroxyethyl)-thiazole monophosphate biosynthesis [Flavobacteriales bacterium]|jgi:4-methyl-5(b-hydroxyethyl)-thiazole monophosphate biosynthesis
MGSNCVPGGIACAAVLYASALLQGIIRWNLALKQRLATIYAAPAVVPCRMGLLDSYKATCHPAFQVELARQAEGLLDAPLVNDRNITTSEGFGTAFTLSVVAKFLGKEKADVLSKAMCL